MAMPTSEELIAAMSGRGLSISAAESAGVICLVSAIYECLTENYDECVANAIALWASILIGASTAGRMVTSQHAPSGASQSFSYGSKPWYALYNQMKMLDTAGCTSDLVEDPTASAKPWFSVVSGSRRCGH